MRIQIDDVLLVVLYFLNFWSLASTDKGCKCKVEVYGRCSMSKHLKETATFVCGGWEEGGLGGRGGDANTK